VVARGSESDKAIDMQKSQVWKKLNGHENKGSDLRFVKHLPNITGQCNQFEPLGGFDFSMKSISTSVSTAGKPVRASHLKWTQAHFSLKISVDLVGEGKHTVSWGKIQPVASRPAQAHQSNCENGSGQPLFDISRHARIGDGSVALQTYEWVTSEGSRTDEEEEGEIPSSSEGLGGSLAANTKLDGEPGTHKEEAGEFQSSSKRLSCPLVTVMKPDDRVSVADSDVHCTVVEAVLSADKELVHSPDVADQTVDQGVGFWLPIQLLELVQQLLKILGVQFWFRANFWWVQT